MKYQDIFYNESKGVKVGDERISSGWTGKYRNSLLVTNRGVHFFVGRTNGDFHEFLDKDSIQNIEARTGIMKNRLIFETEDKTYDFPTDPTAGEVEKVGRYSW